MTSIESPRPSFLQSMKGFPFGQVLIMCLARVSEPISFSSLFPYVYFLTRDFHIARTEAEISIYAGYLGAAFSLAQVLSAIQWSKFSQVHGRKIAIMCGLSGSMLSMLLLGFAKRYEVALLARFLMGLLNGNIAILRSSILEIPEIANNRDFQPLAISTFPLLWQIGCIVGPLLSGNLVHPKEDDDYYKKNDPQMFLPTMFSSTEIGQIAATKSKDFLTRMFPFLEKLNERYPYALANIVVSYFLFNSIIVVYFFMEETHYSKKYEYDSGLAAGDKFLKFLGLRKENSSIRPWELKNDNATRPLIEEEIRTHVDEDPLEYDDNDEEGDEVVNFLNSSSPDSLSEHSSLTCNRKTALSNECPVSYGGTDNYDNNSRTLNISTTIRRTRSFKSSRKPSMREIGPFNRRQSVSLARTVSCSSDIRRLEQDDDTKIPWRALRNPRCYAPILANLLLSMHNICYEEFVPLFWSNDVGYDKNGNFDSQFPFRISGGLGLNTEEVGKILSLTGFCGMFVILIIYPYVDRHFESTKSFTCLHLALIPVYIVLPYCVFTLPDRTHHYEPKESRDLFNTNLFLYSISFCKVFATSMMFPLVQFLTHIGAPPKHRAIINSLAITASAFSRCIFPILAGFLMTFSMSHSIAWLFFWVVGLGATLGLFQSLQLVEEAKDEPEPETV
ncbi:hypothetical protein DASC09_041860 [Saccharomycopsis crataegensis]|uniref:Major facilitator superfamily (MFS) profile domain-containing protein n=1 Tax=Saccharomycopsis crataegensis TaxID=43959 RepID=A0AAV5QQP4_9ASCO|nr:hypothetical protein DASC09_041860 [Saccharomycopsis crataegensis]